MTTGRPARRATPRPALESGRDGKSMASREVWLQKPVGCRANGKARQWEGGLFEILARRLGLMMAFEVGWVGGCGTSVEAMWRQRSKGLTCG